MGLGPGPAHCLEQHNAQVRPVQLGIPGAQPGRPHLPGGGNGPAQQPNTATRLINHALVRLGLRTPTGEGIRDVTVAAQWGGSPSGEVGGSTNGACLGDSGIQDCPACNAQFGVPPSGHPPGRLPACRNFRTSSLARFCLGICSPGECGGPTQVPSLNA